VWRFSPEPQPYPYLFNDKSSHIKATALLSN
jgi:hypothetical protein